MKKRIVPAVIAAALSLGALAVATLSTGPVRADTPGRYTMSPAESGGFVRLDTLTGQMSLCNRTDAQWSCQPMADQGGGQSSATSAELDKLRAENRRLRADIRKLDEMMLSDKGSRKPDLPTEQDVDRAMTYLQRMFKKFQEKLKEFEAENKPVPDKGRPL